MTSFVINVPQIVESFTEVYPNLGAGFLISLRSSIF